MLTLISNDPSTTRHLQSLCAQWGIPLSADAALRLIHDADGLRLEQQQATVAILPTPTTARTLERALRRALSAALSLPPVVLTLAQDWQLDTTLRTLRRGQEHLPLTEKETWLLTYLYQAHPHSCPREQLLADIWRYEADTNTHTLETHIYRLRQKLETLSPPPCRIDTRDGSYQLVL